MVMEVLGHDSTQEQVKEGLQEDHNLHPEVDSKRDITSGLVSDGSVSFGVVDNSNGTNGVVKERDSMANDNIPKDAVDEWPTPKQIHTFYFVKYRSFEDSVLKAKIEQAEKDLQKKNQARQQITETLKAKRSEKSNVISQLKPLTAEDKEYRMKVDEKIKVMRPIRDALGEMRNANNAAREKGMGLCSSEEELDDILHSLHYRMQHESLPLSEEKRLLKEIKQLEGTREKVIANAAQKAKLLSSLGQKEALQGQVKLISGDIDEVKKEQQAVRTKISLLESELKVINDAISSLQEQLGAISEKRDKAYETLSELRKTRDDMNACYFQNRSLLNNAKSLAANKDISGLQKLYHDEGEKFMSQWSSGKDFRVDYERRILSSLDNRQLSRDGRMRNPDEKPILYEAPATKEVELAPPKASVKAAKEDMHPPVQHENAASQKAQDDNLSKPKQVKSTVKEMIPEDTDEYFVSEKSLESSKENKIDAAKLKEIKREEEISKAKQALERKKKQAEKAATKAAAKAQKEAEKKLKEKEKKAKKKAGASAPAESAEEAEAETKEAEPEEATVDVSLEDPVPAKSKEQKENVKYRTKPRGRDSIPKVILKRKKSNSYWIWAAPSAVAVLVLAMLAYYFSFVRK